MTLKRKLLFGYAIFIAALTLLGGWSGWRLHQMSNVSTLIISDNYDSVVAAQEMKESLERLDSSAQFFLVSQRQRALSQFRDQSEKFSAAFAKAAANITEPGEAETIQKIQADRDEYLGTLGEFVSATEAGPSGSGNVERYFRVLEPQFYRLKADCDRLLRINQEAMLTKSQRAAAGARQMARWTVILAALLVITGVTLAIGISRQIIRPLLGLKRAATRIAGGDLDTKAEVVSNDEIGGLALEFNEMAKRLRELRQTDMGKLVIAQQTADSIIDSLYDPILVTDDRGNITRLNPAAERLFGSKDTILGKPVADMPEGSRIGMAVEEALNWQRPVTGESVSSAIPINIEGSEQAYRVRATPMRSDSSRLLGCVVILENVTHFRDLDRLKSEFIAAASEQLQAPFREVQMSIYCLLDGALGELNTQQYEFLLNCRDQIERWDQLRLDLLDLAAIESGEQVSQLKPVDLCELLEKAAIECEDIIAGSNIRLERDLPPTVPYVLADSAQITRVIRELISNARNNTGRGGEIRISVKSLANSVAVSIADTGRGIPGEFLPRIFDRFARVPGGESPGSGLGLTISKRLIEAHGGQISIQSQVNRGTTFTFTLQLAEDLSGSSSGSQLTLVQPGQYQIAALEKLSTELVGVRPGGVLVTARDYTNLHYLKKALAEVNTFEQDLIVVTARLPVPALGVESIQAADRLSDAEQLIFSRAASIAEKAGKPIKLLVVRGTDPFLTTVETAVRLGCSTMIAGASTKMSMDQQARRIGEAWEHITIESKRKLRILKLVAPGGSERIFELGVHRPTITPEDIELTHKIWLDLSGESEIIHHNEVISVALQRLAQSLNGKERDAALAQLRSLHDQSQG